MKDTIRVLEDTKFHYEQDEIFEGNNWKDRIEGLSHAIQILKRVDDVESLAYWLEEKTFDKEQLIQLW